MQNTPLEPLLIRETYSTISFQLFQEQGGCAL
jgi:hypothetical protein